MIGKGIVFLAIVCVTLMTPTLGIASIIHTASTTSETNLMDKISSHKTQVDKNEVHYISGNIKDTKGNALANAFVIPSQDGQLIGQGTYTDQNGTFTLTQLKSGKYNLIVVTIPKEATSYSKAQGVTQLQEVHIKDENIKGLDIVVTE